MNVHYTGRQVELSEAQKKKLDAKFQKIQTILGKRHDPEAHVILSQERHLHIAEVTLRFQHHTMVVERSGADLFGAVQEAVDKLSKQIVRNKDKWREKKRRSREEWETGPEEPQAASAPAGKANGSPARRRLRAAGTPRIFRSLSPAAKPLTVEEAVLELEQDDKDCVVYRDAEKGRVSVLFRRRDGHLELIEA